MNEPATNKLDDRHRSVSGPGGWQGTYILLLVIHALIIFLLYLFTLSY